MRKLNHTASSPPSLASTKAQGKSSSSWRTALMTRLSMPSPSAWNTLENTMATPAKQKLTEMMRRAGMPKMCIRDSTRFAARHNWTVKVLDYLEGDEAGIKSASILVEGHNAYGCLLYTSNWTS